MLSPAPRTALGLGLFAAATGAILLRTTDGGANWAPVTVPDGPTPPTGWPIVLYEHGTGGVYVGVRGEGTMPSEVLEEDAARPKGRTAEVGA